MAENVRRDAGFPHFGQPREEVRTPEGPKEDAGPQEEPHGHRPRVLVQMQDRGVRHLEGDGQTEPKPFQETSEKRRKRLRFTRTGRLLRFTC